MYSYLEFVWLNFLFKYYISSKIDESFIKIG